MKVLVIGCNGQLGHALTETQPKNVAIVGLDLPELDITDASSVLEACRREQPAVIVNAAAYTAVDEAESNPEAAAAINVDGPRNIAVGARETGARLIHVSTDFVFDGKGSTPYREDAPTDPMSVYGRTKRDGELAVLEVALNRSVIVRTSWLYSKVGNNFVLTMLRLMSERDELGIVADQVGTPTWANSLATALWAMAESANSFGIYHWSDAGVASWHEFALAIQEEALELGILAREIPVRAIRTTDYPTAAERPKYSVLDCSSIQKTLSIQPAEWRLNLRKMLKGMTE